MGWGRQEFTGALQYERYGLADTGVRTCRLEGRNMELGPSGRRGPTLRLHRRSRRLWRDMVEVSGSRTAGKTTFCRNVRKISPAPPAAIIAEEKDPLNDGYFEEWYAVDTRSSGRYGRRSE
jgi:hypothetical protein